MSASFQPIHDFIHDLEHNDIPPDVTHQASRCLLDLIGVWAAGSRTIASQTARDHAARRYGTPTEAVPMLFDGRNVSPPGAAFAGGVTLDSIDGHDGHQSCKGHAGAALLPILLACIGDGEECSFTQLISALVVGYEIAHRAGLALHASTPDYHSSGAWNTIGCAAIGARLREFDISQTRHALGIAEYFGPRAQMMRCIDHPSMVKDSSSWGAMVAMTAIDLAETGFTGAPAILCESPDTEKYWSDLGTRWRMRELNFKVYPVCRWAQPAIEAVLSVMQEHQIASDQIDEISVATFHEATRLPLTRPANCDEAQYSLPFPVALAIVTGGVDPADLTGKSLNDSDITAMADRIHLMEKDEYNDAFPDERYADVTITLQDGTKLTSPPMVARGNYDAPLSDNELEQKFRSYTAEILPGEHIDWLAHVLEEGTEINVAKLIAVLSTQPTAPATGSRGQVAGALHDAKST